MRESTGQTDIHTDPRHSPRENSWSPEHSCGIKTKTSRDGVFPPTGLPVDKLRGRGESSGVLGPGRRGPGRAGAAAPAGPVPQESGRSCGAVDAPPGAAHARSGQLAASHAPSLQKNRMSLRFGSLARTCKCLRHPAPGPPPTPLPVPAETPCPPLAPCAASTGGLVLRSLAGGLCEVAPSAHHGS